MENDPPGTTAVAEFKYLDTLSDLLDSRFRIPGTGIRFGLDFLIGLVPYAGDLAAFAFSGGLVVAMARRGASGMVVVKMLWNILLDTIVGSIPVLGDIFDLKFKANRRNYSLLKEHYQAGKHSGSALPAILAVLAVLLLMLAFIVYVSWKILRWAFSWFL